MENKRSDLGFLGLEFQYRLAHHFMDDKKFFRDMDDIVDNNMFTEVNLKRFIGGLKEYYVKYECVPSYDALGFYLKTNTKTDQEIEFIDATIEKVKNTNPEGSSLIKEKACNFFKQQNMVKVLNRMTELIKIGDIDRYHELEELIRTALATGTKDEIGVRLRDNLGEVLSEDYRSVIPTGIEELDKFLEGGIGKEELGMVIGGSGFGKALSVNELVCTSNGFKKMGDLLITDKVIGRDGKQHNILGIFPQGERDIYTVKFSDGVTCDCDMEHLWNVNSREQRRKRRKINGVEYRIPDNSFKTMSLKEIYGKINEKNKTKLFKGNFKIPMTEPVYFDEVIIPELLHPYFMGIFIGDGNFSGLNITTVEKEIIDEISKITKITSIGEDKRRKNVKTIRLSSDLKLDLFKYFTLKEKSIDKFIPTDYLYNSVKNRIELLNGLMDSDGTCHKNGCSCFNAKSKQLADDVKTLVFSLGGYAKVREKKSSYFNKKYNKKIDCGIQYEVTITLCNPNIPIFKLKRKQDRVVYRNKYKNNRYFESITYKGREEAICIKVDSEDELFLTRDFIVTHNTTMSVAISSHAAYNGFKVVQIFFEDKEKQVQRKHISRITEIEARNLSKPENIEHVKDVMSYTDAYDENLILKKFNTGEVSPLKIKTYLKRLINTGFIPDMVIVDYFECLVPSKSIKDQWEGEAHMMRQLESMASELNIGLWVMTQGNRESMNGDLITLGKASGSFKKIQISHMVVTISRGPEDITNNIATLALLKNRAGQTSPPIEDVTFNNGTCIINTDNATTYNDLNEFKKAEQEREKATTRGLLKDRKEKNKVNSSQELDEPF